MWGERRLRIMQMLETGGSDRAARRLCEVSAEVTAMSGAGIMLMSEDGPRGSICTTNKLSATIETLQYDLGEGPCIDAYSERRSVLEPDLVSPEELRWPAFREAAIVAGARAVFGFPLQIGAVRLGALNLNRTDAGPLSDDQYADALVMADVAAHAVLAMQADSPPGAIAAELETSEDFQNVVHQATGMVAAQLEVTVNVALARLRAYAFAQDRPLAAVAADIVDRKLRLTDGKDTSDG
jgi:hypothetical protein